MGLFKKRADNKPEYIDKPYEWFISEEGRQSYLKYCTHFKDMLEYLTEGNQRDGFIRIGQITSPDSQKIWKPTENQTLWPCHYWYYFLRSIIKRDEKNLRYTIGYFIGESFITGTTLFYLSAFMPEKWPDVLLASDNPLLNYITKQTNPYFKLHDRLDFIHIKYICDVKALKDVDASDEDWLYDEEIYLNKRGEMRDKIDIINLISEKVKYKDIFERCI